MGAKEIVILELAPLQAEMLKACLTDSFDFGKQERQNWAATFINTLNEHVDKEEGIGLALSPPQTEMLKACLADSFDFGNRQRQNWAAVFMNALTGHIDKETMDAKLQKYAKDKIAERGER